MSPIVIALLVAVVAANFAMGAKAAKIVRSEPELRHPVQDTDYVFYILFGVFFLPIALHQRSLRCRPLKVEG